MLVSYRPLGSSLSATVKLGRAGLALETEALFPRNIPFGCGPTAANLNAANSAPQSRESSTMADTPAAAAAPPVKEEGIKRAAPGDDAPKYPPPLKKNVSAFLHFCAEQREAVKAENPEITGKAGEITKILGQRWKALDGDAKARYNEMAAADKRRYDAEKKERGGDAPKPAKKDAEPHETIIPVARVKKICRADPEVRSMAKEATVVMAKAAEIFVQNLAVATHAVASTRTLRADHVAQAVRDRPDFAFLRVEFPKVDYKPKEAGPKKGPAAPANQPSIASFFKKPKPEAEA